MRIGFSGTRLGLTQKQRFNFIRWFQVECNNMTEWHEGDCMGSDAEVVAIVKAFRRTIINPLIISHPPLNERLRAFAYADEIRDAKGYVERDKDIATESDMLVITPKDYNRTGGTWITANFALEQVKPVLCFWPDGTVEEIR